MQKLDDEGRIYYPTFPSGKQVDTSKRPRLKRYLAEQEGTIIPNLWTDIQPLHAVTAERIGYPTQKPLALLERIIEASSEPGAVVLDAFCGCGTSLEAAAKLKRDWIGIDVSPTACRVMSDRLEARLGLKLGTDFKVSDMPKTAGQLRLMPAFEFENWAVVALGGIPNKAKVNDKGVDGRLYPVEVKKPADKKSKANQGDFLASLDKWFPIQVKQMDHVGRPAIDNFETAMRRDKRTKGYFVAFGYTQDAIKEIKRANTQDGLEIVHLTVDEVLEFEKKVA